VGTLAFRFARDQTQVVRMQARRLVVSAGKDRKSCLLCQKRDRDLSDSSRTGPKCCAQASLERGGAFPSVVSMFANVLEIAISKSRGKMAPKCEILDFSPPNLVDGDYFGAKF